MDIDPLPAIEPLSSLLSVTAAIGPSAFSAGQIAALLCALAALLLSGFVSGSEIAFFSLEPQQLDELEDDPKGDDILQVIRQPEKLLATILIANNLVNVTIVVLCNFALGPVFAGMPEVMSFILQTVLLTFLILLFGEILPKLIANSGNLRWVRFAIPGMRVMMKMFSPLAAMLVRSSGIVKKVVTKEQHDVTTDELSKALEITDVKTDDDKEMLEGILRFGDTTASEVMTPRVDMTDIDIDNDFNEVMKVVLDSGYSRLPVYKETQDNIQGVLYSRDLLPYIGKADASFDWRKLLRKPYFVPETRMIDDLLEDFRSRRLHMAIVVDEFGGTQGIVTLEDVLEEIVGDINDEYDEVDHLYQRISDDSFIFEARTPLTDFFRLTGLEPEEYAEVTEDSETLAGMILSIKGDFPREKETIEYGRLRFLIITLEGRRIAKVKVRILPETEPKEENGN